MASPLGAQAPAVRWTPFTFTSAAGDTLAADSGRVVVPESRAHPGGPTIQIAVVRVRSTARRPGAPVVYLAGGPGGAGIAGARGEIFPTVAALRAVSDVILFDQRGTGSTLPSLLVRTTLGVPPTVSSASAEAKAALLERSRAAVAEVRARGVDLAAYNTVENADDLDDVRKAVGAERWIVWGHSYGTHLGLAYLKRHGAHVERAILGGINGLDHRRRFPSDADTLFARLAAHVRATPRLREQVPDLVGSLRRVLARLAREPVTARVDSQDVLVSREDVQTVIALQSGEQAFVRRLPMIVGQMEAGDFAWMARQVRDAVKSRPLGTAMTYATDLASGVSPERARRIRAEAPAALLGNAINFPFDDPDFQAVWGARDLGSDFRAPVRSAVPALFISGTLDGRTSLRDAEEVRRGFRNGAHVIVEGASHNPYAVHPMVRDLMVRFARGERVRGATVRLTNVELRGPDEPALVEELRRVAAEQGPEAAAARLRALAAPGATQHLTTFVVTGAAQALAAANRSAAAAIIRAGAELFPENSGILLRLAEAEAADGRADLALVALRRAVAADPFNQQAAAQLRRLAGSR
jgi:pimeloyl-ACP methyl ester carboxylesterase